MGNLFRSSKIIHTQTAGATATLNGSTHALRPGNDEIPDYQQDFAVVFKTVGASMSSTPSITPKLQTSWNGTDWIDAVAGTALTADGTLIEQKAITSTKLGPFVRAVATIAGTATYTGTVTLISNAHFTTSAS